MKSLTVTKAKIIIRSVLLIMLFPVSSCIKDMISQVDLPQSYSPDIAIAVGKTTLTVNNYFYNYAADTSPLADSLGVYFDDAFYLVDSADLEMGDFLPFAIRSFTSNPNNIQSVLFRVNIYNGYPSQTMYQVYLLDGGYNMLDSLLLGNDRYLDPATISNDSVIQKTFCRRDILFNSQRIQQSKDVEHLRIKTGLIIDTSTIDTIKLFPEYQINVQVGVRIKLNVNPDSAINTFQNFEQP